MFVDKSLFIRRVVLGGGLLFVIRPSKWGKSVNMSMLKTFFDCPLTPDGKPDLIKIHLNRALFIGK